MSVAEAAVHDITLRCLPGDDGDFVDAVRAESHRLALDARQPPDLLTTALRVRYPEASVRVQDALSQLGPSTVWYVYRDGEHPHMSESGRLMAPRKRL